MYPTQDVFIEVEPRTGGVTECNRTQDGYKCERVTERDALLQKESGPKVRPCLGSL
jgi:hypothetical protein